MPIGIESEIIFNNCKQCEAKLKKVIHKYMPQIFVRFNLQIQQVTVYVCNHLRKSIS